MLLNDMDISRLMVYAQHIEESKIREITQERKRPRFDNSSQPKPKKRFYHQESSMGKKKEFPTKIPKELDILLRGLGVLLVGNNIWVSIMPEQMISLLVLVRITRLGTSLKSSPNGKR